MLYKFISGFSRFSPRAELPEIGEKLVRADILQNFYLASLKSNMPLAFSTKLAYLAKNEQDRASAKFVRECDIFMFYNGSGLSTMKKAHEMGKICIVEAVNSHVDYQEVLLREEHEKYGLAWRPFDKLEKAKRLEEYEKADYILLPSDFVKRSFIEYGFDSKKLIKVPYGFSAFSNTNVKAEDTSGDFNVLYVGSVSVRKGLRYLIEAFTMLKHPKKKLLIVGPQSKITGIDGMVLPPEIEFLGVLKGEALENVYKRGNVFCLPSIEEGLALVLGEALSFGIPIIATSNTGADEIVEDGKDGFIVPIRDSKSIFEKLKLIADDSELYAYLRRNAKEKAATMKGWDETERLLTFNLTEIFNNHRY
ncbi:hypothetical protein RG47T_0587 [Mucilaginibacter polytrichastri]|uniref:Glycosyl transferase family 1 domain-containing protein n=2 Tax=Mucilaginibacter polytrichastri TaxID=1302689 RepID=A0A1Q5ZTT6_9SPHI|nr:hypothetical protein RG47T_0587 [Mucilaginibacter polytrichastri]